MGLDGSLSSYTDRDRVDNVVVFISDSLRFDALPPAVAERALWGRAIATSTFTGSGFPSIVTGLYPSKHGVWNFEESLPETPPLFAQADHTGFDVRDIWSWPMQVLNLPVPDWDDLTERFLLPDLPEPFLYVLHDKGGHVPYGDSPDDWDSTDQFFESVNDPGSLRSRYHESIATSMGEFERVLDALETREILERTLVILTSDHGELLGEYGGLWGHTKPMVPELLSVPMAFLGAGIEVAGHYDRLLSTADVAPTAMRALGTSLPGGLDGEEVWATPVGADRRVQAHVWQGGPDNPFGAEYQAASLWDRDGGLVRHLNPLRQRIPSALAQYTGEFGSVNRSLSPVAVFQMLRAHLKGTLVYGDPGVGITEARATLPATFDKSVSQAGGADIQPDEDQLRKLGYL